VIALVARTDVVQRAEFIERLGSQVRFVDDDASLLAALARARQQLVVIVGHVEEDAFVVRGADDAILMSHKIASVHQAIDEARSVALLMGWGVACKVPSSGPTAEIDAFDVIKGLRAGSQSPSEDFRPDCRVF
jgi:hypothetical protein